MILFDISESPTGLKDEALGLGLNVGALTLSLKEAEVAEVGEPGVLSSATVDIFGVPVPEPEAVGSTDAAPLLVPDVGPSAVRLPLNGGIAWITIFLCPDDVATEPGAGVGALAAAAAAAFIASFAAAGFAAATGP